MYTVNKSSPLVIPEDGTDRIENLIHLPQVHAVHRPVQFAEVFLNSVVVHSVDLAVGFVEKLQNGFAAVKVWRVFGNLFSWRIDVFFHKQQKKNLQYMGITVGASVRILRRSTRSKRRL